jgi:hypothetical protein
MDRPLGATQVVLHIVRMIPGAAAFRQRDDAGGLFHQVLLQPPDPDGGRPCMQLLTSAPSDHETYVVTCPQVPGFTLLGGTEEEVLTMAQLAIESAVAARKAGLGP